MHPTLAALEPLAPHAAPVADDAPAPAHAPEPRTTTTLAALIHTAAEQHRRQAAQAAAQAAAETAARALQARNAHD